MPIVTAQSPGQCYQATYDLLLELEDDAVLIHGYPRCTGDDHRGKKMGHAWIEVERLGQTWCIDHSRPDSLIHVRMYYAAGQIDPDECKRYTRRMAISLARRSGRAGPWGKQPKDSHFAEDS